MATYYIDMYERYPCPTDTIYTVVLNGGECVVTTIGSCSFTWHEVSAEDGRIATKGELDMLSPFIEYIKYIGTLADGKEGEHKNGLDCCPCYRSRTELGSTIESCFIRDCPGCR